MIWESLKIIYLGILSQTVMGILIFTLKIKIKITLTFCWSFIMIFGTLEAATFVRCLIIDAWKTLHLRQTRGTFIWAIQARALNQILLRFALSRITKTFNRLSSILAWKAIIYIITITSLTIRMTFLAFLILFIILLNQCIWWIISTLTNTFLIL